MGASKLFDNLNGLLTIPQDVQVEGNKAAAPAQYFCKENKTLKSSKTFFLGGGGGTLS